MARYKFTHPITGQQIILTGDEEPTDADVEQSFNEANAYRSRPKSLITERPNLWSSLGRELSPETDPFQDKSKGLGRKLLESYGKMGRLGLLGMGAAGQSIEGAIAGPILAAQRGQFKDIPTAFVKGATGEYPAEIGDVLNELGMPETVNQIGGLAGSAFLPGIGQLAKGVAKARAIGMRGADKALAATGRKAADITGAIGRIDPGVTAYGRKTDYRFVKPFQSPDSVVEELVTAEEKARGVAQRLRSKMSKDFGDVMQKYNAKDFKLINSKGTFTGGDVIKQLMDEGKLMLDNVVDKKTGEVIDTKLIPTAIGSKVEGMTDIADYLDMLYKSKGKLKGGQLRTIVEGLMQNYPKNPFANRLAADIRDTMGMHSTELKTAVSDYARRQAILEGANAGSVGALSVTKESTTGATSLGDVLTASPRASSRAARRRAILESLEKESGEQFTDELYDAVANMQMSKWAPATQLSLAGAATAAGGVATGRPGLAVSSILAALGLSPRGQALTQKGINNIRSSAIKLRHSPVVQQTLDFIDKGIIDPGVVRQMTGRNAEVE